MSKTITLSVPHKLTQEQAKARIDSGVTQFRSQFAGHVAQIHEQWTGNRMAFRFTVLNQAVNGTVDVESEQVVLNVELPWVLAMFADRIRPQVEDKARKLLGPP